MTDTHETCTIEVPLGVARAVAGFASKEECRPMLAGIRVTTEKRGAGEDGIVLVATDGHMLVRYLLPDGAVTGLPAEGIILSPEIVPKAGKAGTLRITVDLATGRCEGETLGVKAPKYTRGSTIDGPFPDYRMVIPKRGVDLVPTLAVSLGAPVLAMYKALALADVVGVTFFLSGPDRALAWDANQEFDGGKFDGVLMPIRVSRDVPVYAPSQPDE